MTWCYQNIRQLNSEKQSIKMENVLNKTKKHKNWELTKDRQNKEELKQMLNKREKQIQCEFIY